MITYFCKIFCIHFTLQIIFSLKSTCDSHYSHKISFMHFCDETRPECANYCTCRNNDFCISKEMNPRLRNFIAFKLNVFRQEKVKSNLKPSGMSMLYYDQQLEEISTCHVGKCVANRSDCFLTEMYSEVGQATAVLDSDQLEPSGFNGKDENDMTLYEKLWQEVITTIWEKDIASLDDRVIRKYNRNANVNGALIMYDYATSVGCAHSTLMRDGNNSMHFTCTFGPDLKTGEPIYHVGDICTQCQPGFFCSESQPFPMLCQHMDDYEEESEVPMGRSANKYLRRRKRATGAAYTINFINPIFVIILTSFILLH